jgi:hypothetical protein
MLGILGPTPSFFFVISTNFVCMYEKYWLKYEESTHSVCTFHGLLSIFVPFLIHFPWGQDILEV